MAAACASMSSSSLLSLTLPHSRGSISFPLATDCPGCPVSISAVIPVVTGSVSRTLNLLLLLFRLLFAESRLCAWLGHLGTVVHSLFFLGFSFLLESSEFSGLSVNNLVSLAD